MRERGGGGDEVPKSVKSIFLYVLCAVVFIYMKIYIKWTYNFFHKFKLPTSPGLLCDFLIFLTRYTRKWYSFASIP